MAAAKNPLRRAEHPHWRGDDASWTAKHGRAIRWYSIEGVTCEYEGGCDCPATDRHHINGDPGNNDRSNLAFLCRRHHMVVDGRLQRLIATPRRTKPPVPCVHCGRVVKVTRRGLCGACNEYLRRTGEDRPIDPTTGEVLVRKFIGRIEPDTKDAPCSGSASAPSASSPSAAG